MQISKYPPISAFHTRKIEIGFSQNLPLILARFYKVFERVRFFAFGALCPGDFITLSGGQALPILGALVERLKAHTGNNIDIPILNHIWQNCKRKRADLLRLIQYIFCNSLGI